MLHQIRKQHAAHLARMFVDWSGVIDDPFALCCDNHRMILRIGFKQAKKDQVAGTGDAEVTADKECIRFDERLRIGKLGESSVRTSLATNGPE